MPFPCPKLTKTNEQTKQTVCLSPAPNLPKRTNKRNKPCAFPLPQLTKTNERTNETNRVPFPCHKLTPLSNHEFRAKGTRRALWRQSGRWQRGGRGDIRVPCQDNNCTDTIEAKLRDNSAPTRPATRQKRDTLVFQTKARYPRFRYRLRMADHKRARTRAHLPCWAVFPLNTKPQVHLRQNEKTRSLEARDIHS